MQIRSGHALLGALLLILALGAGCKKSSSSSGPLTLFLVAFPEDQRSDLYRDQTLRFDFSIPVDPTSIDADSIQVLALPGRTPVSGLYTVTGSVVMFNPVVDEGAPNPGNLPLNPYGFAELTQFEVVIEDQGMKTVRGALGEMLTQRFTGTFGTAQGFTPRPNDPDLNFAPFDQAVYDTTNPPYTPANPKGTLEPNDDILGYTPVPTTPPINPMTNRPDYRAGHPTNVLIQAHFNAVVNPATVRTQSGGNVVLEYEQSPNQWMPVAMSATPSPSGKTLVLSAATPLANATRINRYRVRFDTGAPIESRGGRPLIPVVEVWDNLQRQTVRRLVVQDDLTILTRLQVNETGPWSFFDFPIDAAIVDTAASDSDVTIANQTITPAAGTTRTASDTTACSLPSSACQFALREPLTQSLTSPNPNPNSKGPSKVQFLFNSYQHAGTAPSPYALPDAEALVDMAWAPQQGMAIPATYPKLYIVLDSASTNSTLSTVPAGLGGVTYAANLENPPGTAVRDGSTQYIVAGGQQPFVSWQFERPFMNYRRDRSIVFTAWTEVGGETEQTFAWYSPTNMPNTRIFSPPRVANPSTGLAGQWCYYHTRFNFVRVRSLVVTKYYRITSAGTPTVRGGIRTITPMGKARVDVEYAGATFASYTPRTIGNRTLEEGVGTPISRTGFSADARVASGHDAIGVRVRFTLDPYNPTLLPSVNSIALAYTVP